MRGAEKKHTGEKDMRRDDNDFKGRRSLIAGLGVAGAGLALGSTAARAQRARDRRGFQPARHEIDAWMGELPGTHRIFVDSATAQGGAEALIYANNLYSAQTNAYAGDDADLAMIICFRHFSTPFGFNDAVWKKYGEAFGELIQFSDPATGEALMTNPVNTPGRTDLPNFGMTVDSITARGAQIAICNAATQFFSGQLADRTGGSANDIYEELRAGAIANSRFVPAGVMALTRAQEYDYSVLIAG
jgi:hypothetical protein